MFQDALMSLTAESLVFKIEQPSSQDAISLFSDTTNIKALELVQTNSIFSASSNMDSSLFTAKKEKRDSIANKPPQVKKGSYYSNNKSNSEMIDIISKCSQQQQVPQDQSMREHAPLRRRDSKLSHK